MTKTDSTCTRHSYYVCEKTDGIRYLLYLTKDEYDAEAVYLIDRKNDYYFIQHRNLHFPRENDDNAFHINTIIDGELVMDHQPNGTKMPSFLVFDCLVLDGMVLMERPLDKRLAYLQQNIYKPYNRLFRRFPDELKFQAFKFVMKDMQFSYGITKMFNEVLPSLTHGNDGLIFTCRETPYKCGTDEHILKWKPADENSVDFKLLLDFPTVEPDEQDIAEGVTEPYIDYESVPPARLQVWLGDNNSSGQNYADYAELYLTEDEWEELKGLGDPLPGRIIECYVDEQGRWRMSRFRDDKPNANHTSTVEKVIESIQNPVTRQMLEDTGPTIRERWKTRHGEKA